MTSKTCPLKSSCFSTVIDFCSCWLAIANDLVPAAVAAAFCQILVHTSIVMKFHHFDPCRLEVALLALMLGSIQSSQCHSEHIPRMNEQPIFFYVSGE